MFSPRDKNLSPSIIFFLLSVFVVCVAFGVRIFQLASVPAGMSWDEAAIGYNGYGIWTVHRDEWLHRVPLSFRSFGDYKAPFAIYLNSFFTLIFGLNLWAVRLPFVLAGVVAVAGIMCLTFVLYRLFIPNSERTGLQEKSFYATVLMSGIFLAFSPWHIFFSRASFESGIALTFIIWGMTALLYSFIVSNKKILISLISALSFVLSLYTYHSAKIFVPLFVFLLVIIFRKRILQHKSVYFYSFIFGVLCMLPLLYSTIWGKASTRFTQTSIIASETLTTSKKITGVFYNLYSHFTLSYLVNGQTTTLRHGDGHWGVLYISELVLIIGTLLFLAIKKFYFKDASDLMRGLYKITILSVLFIMIGVVPAIIGLEVPHSNRALLSYPGYLLIESMGVFLLIREVVKREKLSVSASKLTLIIQSTLGVGLIIHLLLVVSFFHDYFGQYKNDSVSSFNYGYEQAFETINALEDEVDNIVITSSYGQPYIYALFFRKTNPIFYHGGSLFKYIFPDKVTVGDLMRKNALIVATPQEIEPSLADSLIIAPNGEVRFVIIRTKSE